MHTVLCQIKVHVEWSLVDECDAVSEICDVNRVSVEKKNNETDYSCKQLLKDSYLIFNDLEGQHTLISLWFQRQVTENRKGILGCPRHS